MLPKPYYDEDGITIYHGDCRDILPHLPKFDLLLTDPPYGLGEAAGKNKSRSSLATSKDYGDFSWDNTTIDGWVELCNSRKSIIWGGNYYSLPPTPSWLVWDKRNGANDFADCELAWSNLGCAVRKIEHLWHGMIRQDNEQRFHPTQKPLKVISWALSLAGEIETVLDPFMGSGTTLVAAKMRGLKAVGIEREKEYCRIAVERLAQKNLFGQTGDSQ